MVIKFLNWIYVTLILELVKNVYEQNVDCEWFVLLQKVLTVWKLIMADIIVTFYAIFNAIPLYTWISCNIVFVYCNLFKCWSRSNRAFTL